MAYRATSATLGLVAEGEAIVVLLEASGQTVQLPEAFKGAVEKLEASGLEDQSIQK